MKQTGISAAVHLANSGKRFPVMKLVRDDPGLAAAISKLVTPQRTPSYDGEGNRSHEMPNAAMFNATSNSVAQNIHDAQTVMQVLPDMELSAQILVSSIISPKDMNSTELTFVAPEDLMNPEVAGALIARIRTHFKTVHKIEPLLPKILRDVLFETGSYAVAAIPESSIDDIINGPKRVSLESVRDLVDSEGQFKLTGLLGPVVAPNERPNRKPGLALESLGVRQVDLATIAREVNFAQESALGKSVETFITVTDNPAVLKLPKLNERIREARVIDALGIRSLESNLEDLRKKKAIGERLTPGSAAVQAAKLTDRSLSNLVFKHREYGYKPVASLKTSEQAHRRSVGEPLVQKFPSESVIPVYVPGHPEKHVGYFVMLDVDGNPICKTQDTDYYQELQTRLTSNGSFPSAMLQKVQNGFNGFDCRSRDHLDYSTRVFGQMMDADLLARLRNGVYGNGVALAKNDEIYRIMMSRALAKQHTQLLFVPVELMTYFAFRYDNNGIGQSLLDGMKILNSLRAMLLFAETMAAVKNSVGRTEVKLKLDERDPDPQKAIETTMHDVLRSRNQFFPLGANSPTDLVDYLSRAAYEFTFEGHPGLPDVSIEFNEKSTNYPKPDQELSENLRKASIQATGLSPEQVDAGFNAEFATTVVNNNLLLAKRVSQIQEIFLPQLADHCRKITMASEELIDDMLNMLKENYDKIQADFDEESKKEVAELGEVGKHVICERLLRDFIMNFEVSLPSPNTVTLENQMEALKNYTEALDTALDAYISDSFFTTDVGGDLANEVSTAKAAIKAYFVRKWMVENSVLPELADLTTTSEDGKPMLNLFEVQSDHINSLTKSLSRLMVKTFKTREDANKVVEAMGGELEGGGGDSSSSSDDNSGSDDDLGMGDFDLGSDMPGSEEEQPAEEPAAEETPPKEGEEETPPEDENAQ